MILVLNNGSVSPKIAVFIIDLRSILLGAVTPINTDGIIELRDEIMSKIIIIYEDTLSQILNAVTHTGSTLDMRAVGAHWFVHGLTIITRPNQVSTQMLRKFIGSFHWPNYTHSTI